MAGPYADAVVPGLLLGQALGRFGDFLVGGEYAIPTTVPSAVTFTGLTLPYEGGFNIMITIKGGGTEPTATGGTSMTRGMQAAKAVEKRLVVLPSSPGPSKSDCGDGTCGCGCGLPLSHDGKCSCGCERVTISK